jgi:DNA-binding MarR family transcriptional regulator
MTDPEIDREDDAQRLAHLLWEVGARNSLLSEAALSRTPLTPSAAGMLDTIKADPGVSIAEISRRLPVSPQAVSQVVSRLEGLGFVERRIGERGRAVALFITELGEKAHRNADERRLAYEEELAEALGPKRYRELLRLLKETRTIVIGMERGRDLG